MTRSGDDLRDILNDWAGGALAHLGDVTCATPVAAEGGASSETWLVNARVGADHRRWVLRIEPRGHQVYQDPSVARQYRVIETLAAEPGLPVPAPVALEADAALLGAPFFLMERAEGTAPPNDYHRRGLFADATPAAREAMWAEGIALMAQLHRLAPAPFAFLAAPGLAPESDGIAQELARWDAYRRWADIPQLPLYDRARLWLEDRRPAPVPSGFAWGDARPCNMLFAGQRCTALLDWETASLGGAESDLSWWLFYDRMVSEAEGIARLDGLPDAAATIALWEAEAGRKTQAMDWHLIFAGYRFALISERARNLAIKAGRLPADAWGEANPAVRLLRDLLND
ncbi:MAG TPA: phosphotransferase family protein [Sphingopyxis sp.]|nr:phosphotransferase family protein [Sphingopyxis sp.]HMP44918.1 phosphotransferase family protein [Sphingopyxis sp.]HMQ18378.1 phosphotransferase family protein [Sphingopyxis sp.]